jgi:hypothetical protein
VPRLFRRESPSPGEMRVESAIRGARGLRTFCTPRTDDAHNPLPRHRSYRLGSVVPESSATGEVLAVDHGVRGAAGRGRDRLSARHPLRRHAGPSRSDALDSIRSRSRLRGGPQLREIEHLGIWNLGFGIWALWMYFTAVTASHGLLDALTNGGRGIAFFAPFSNHRFFFPWRPIQVSPIGVGLFSARGLAVLQSELRWILLPSVIIALLARMRVRLKPDTTGRSEQAIQPPPS